MSDNTEQIEFWNGRAGESWTELQDEMDASLANVTRALFACAAVQPGERVLDVGCGTGETTLSAADAVGATGSAVGVDVSAPMLALAEKRAAGRTNVSFRRDDAASADLGGPYDLVLSRFGVMFFADPVAAFRNLARVTRPGGRVVFACWQDMTRSDWLTRPMAVVKPLLEKPAPFPPPDPDAPGPNAFARRERVEQILTGAGFTDVVMEPSEVAVPLGRSVPDAVAQMLRIGPVARSVAEESPEVRARATEVLTKLLTEIDDEGPLELGASIWLVRARH